MIGYLAEEIKNIISENSFGYIGCNDGFNTYIYPTYYYYDGKFIICQGMYSPIIEVMRQNNRICFQIESNPISPFRKSITVLGEFKEIKDIRQRFAAIKAFVERDLHLKAKRQLPPSIKMDEFFLNKENLPKPIIYSISIDEVSGS